MKTINKDPRECIPQITERDLTENAVILHIKDDYGDQWLYLAGMSPNIPGNMCWIGGNLNYCSQIDEWSAYSNSRSLIELILNTYKRYEDFEPFVWIAESMSEVDSILNNIRHMDESFKKEFMVNCSYMEP